MASGSNSGSGGSGSGTVTQNSIGEDSSIMTLMTTLGTCSNTTWTYSSGGYDYELVEIADSRYECPICLLCLRDPVLTACGHKFCSSCIRHWVVNLGGKCPVDAVSLSPENIFPDNFTRREIMQSKAKCPYKKDGCEVILPINELERHVHSEHPGKMNGSHYSGGVDVIDCLYKQFGCDVRVIPSEMQRHVEVDAPHHVQLLETAYNRLKMYSTSTSRTNIDYPSYPPDSFWRQDSRDSTRRLLDDTPEDDNYEFRRQRSWDSVRFAHNQNKHNARPRFPPSRLAESDESLCKPHPSSQSGEASAQSSSGTYNSVKGSCNGTASTVTSGSEPQINELFERLVRLEQNDREKQIKIQRLETELTSAVKLFSAATRIIQDVTARYCHGVFVWKIPNFAKLCLGMRKDPNRVLHSPGFYTDVFGYKLCLRFNLTTPSSHGAAAVQPVDVPLEHDTETYISLYVHFMKGEFDDTLRWPFSGEMSLLVIHPSNPEQSIVETMTAKHGAAAYGKPNLPRNPTGIGFPEFCPTNKAFLEGFVRDDALVCKIHAKAQYNELKDL